MTMIIIIIGSCIVEKFHGSRSTTSFAREKKKQQIKTTKIRMYRNFDKLENEREKREQKKKWHKSSLGSLKKRSKTLREQLTNEQRKRHSEKKNWLVLSPPFFGLPTSKIMGIVYIVIKYRFVTRFIHSRKNGMPSKCK